MTTTQQALDYIKNAGGMIKEDVFINDLYPFGYNLLNKLIEENKALIREFKSENHIFLIELN